MRTAADSPSDRPDACPLAKATWTSVVCWQGARCPRGGPAPPRRGHSEAKPVAPPWGSAAAKPSALTGEGAALRRERAPARRPPPALGDAQGLPPSSPPCPQHWPERRRDRSSCPPGIRARRGGRAVGRLCVTDAHWSRRPRGAELGGCGTHTAREHATDRPR